MYIYDDTLTESNGLGWWSKLNNHILLSFKFQFLQSVFRLCEWKLHVHYFAMIQSLMVWGGGRN